MIAPAYFSEQIAARMPNATLRLLSRGGHFVPAAEPEEYNRAVQAFLQES